MTNPHNSPMFLTNVLLSLIAALLLVLVIQTGMSSSPGRRPAFVTESSIPYHQEGGAPMTTTEGRNPSVAPTAQNMAHNMFFMAIKAFPQGCENYRILDECNSPAAQAVKAKIESIVAEGAGPRQVFDFVVKTWGEKVLTEQALQIRNMRVKGK